jgi:alpha-amylase
MFTAGGAPGEVHSYFSSFNTPADAFVTAQAAILDFENRVRLAIITANEPFLFYTGEGEKNFAGIKSWSLKGFADALRKISAKSMEFHNFRGDFERWAEKSLQDKTLARQLKQIRLSKLQGEALRRTMTEATSKRYDELSTQIQSITGCF